MAERVRALRGFNEVLPDRTPAWRGLMARTQQAMDLYGYQEIRLPLLEATELFARSVGATTDIVEKEMFSFVDRDKHAMSLRPEGTAGCVRAGIDHGLLHNQQQRLWYAGPMFRHERPQAGRYRQFEQVGAEAYGMAGPDIDIEMIALSSRLLRALGVGKAVTLELNTIGSAEARAGYRQALVAYLRPHFEALDPDSQRRLDSNPLRIFDSKVAATQAIVANAPAFDDYLDAESATHFAAVKAGLDALGIRFVLNPRLVRGLDYYSRTVFEWTTTELGAQGTVCAGGRYDALVAQLGGGEVPAVGFAMGLERVLLLADACGSELAADCGPQLYLCQQGVVESAAHALGEDLRNAGYRVVVNAGGGKLKAQLKRADRSGAVWALILGESEQAGGTVLLKPLRGDGEQEEISRDALLPHLRRALGAATNN